MSAKLAQFDGEYRRRMGLSLPLSAGLLALLFVVIPPDYLIAPHPDRAGYPGPLQILPEIDILPDEPDPRHLTAAPRTSPPTDFVAYDLDYAVVPEHPPVPDPSPAPQRKEEEKTLPEFSEIDDVQDAIVTSGHPILAASEYELLYHVKPVYPRLAREMGVQGLVEILMLVDTRGRVSRVKILNRGRYPLLEQAVTDAAYQYIFRTHLENGKPTPFWIRAPFEFHLLD